MTQSTHQVIRMFHPVGQGIFYSERHIFDNNGKEEKFNIVYDCGSYGPKSKYAEKVVKNAFSDDEEIDVLFISHFDSDHVNLINILKISTKIKFVVLPYLSDEDKKLLKILYSVDSENSIGLSLINDPSDFFGNATKIILIKETASDGLINNENTPEDISKLNQNITLDSGVKLSMNNNPSWVYIPYNYKFDQNRRALLEILKSEKVNIKSLSEIINFDEKKLRKVYKALAKNNRIILNLNSMLVYSGPNNIQKDSYYEHLFINRPACIYSGDTDFNKVKINDLFKSYWNNIGTIQISHHGSGRDYDNNFFDKRHYFNPISFDNTNNHGHPANYIIADILKNNSIPILVTEDLNSVFYQTYKLVPGNTWHLCNCSYFHFPFF